MFLPIKPVIDRRLRKDGTAVICIQYCYSSDRRTLLPTDLSLPPRYWNKRLSRISPELPPEFGQAEQLNAQLQKMIRAAEDIVNAALKEEVPDPIPVLKKTWNPSAGRSDLSEKAGAVAKPADGKPGVNQDFFYQLDDYIKAKSRKVSPGMIRTYKVMKNRLIAFQRFQRQKIEFSGLDFNFYESFVNYLTYDHTHMRRNISIRGLKRNSIGTSIKQLRIFVRDRVRRKIIAPIDLTDFKILDEETDAIYLTSTEIDAICKVDLSADPHLDRFRNMFVLGCLTGLRFSDYSSIRPEDIRNGMLYKKQGKSDHWVVIPLRSTAYDIIVNRFKNKIPKTTNEELNRHIKKIGQLAGINIPIKASYKKGNQDIVVTKPKYAWITSHTCRRSFCTNEFLAGTPSELIMKISGHKSLKDFYKYIRITPEEAGKKMQEIWEKRREMSCLSLS
ncbi:MAG: integrase [Sphingobacteriales bacterium 50-39]|mgnify:CR=1 FL=1|nr:site-specific integrase [Sphingobacteriales bacterium]OJW55602.1 MAG: integrase [Sphingobacteriales bacterium 50-39]